MTKALDCIAGSINAGCLSTLIGHPLDTIKVLKQTNPKFSTASSLYVAKTLAKGDITRLYRGIGSPMANQIIMNSVMFSVFHKIKDVTNNDNNDHGDDRMMLDENSAALCAGLFSGFATAFLSTPSDWIKIQAQISLTRRPNQYQGKGQANMQRQTDAISIVRRLLEDSQYKPMKVTRTLYRGHLANLGREGIFTMVYLGLYDRIANAVKDRHVMNQNDDDNHHNNHNGNNEQFRHLHMGEVIMISSFTGACAWICNYPFDTLKSVIQGTPTSKQEQLSMRSAIRLIYKSGGLKAFFRGVGASTFRAMLVTSTRMLAYEKTIQLLDT